jgi:hypothetical protein
VRVLSGFLFAGGANVCATTTSILARPLRATAVAQDCGTCLGGALISNTTRVGERDELNSPAFRYDRKTGSTLTSTVEAYAFAWLFMPTSNVASSVFRSALSCSAKAK